MKNKVIYSFFLNDKSKDICKDENNVDLFLIDFSQCTKDLIVELEEPSLKDLKRYKWKFSY